MKIIVTHMSPDWDAITSVWLIKKYLSGWQQADVRFVPAGQKFKNQEAKIRKYGDDPIEIIGEDEVIHVDTGLGPLDHHQTQDKNVCGASLTWDYVLSQFKEAHDKLTPEHTEAVSRIVKVVVAIDHF